MSHLDNTTNKGKCKHLNYEKRLKIEALSKAGLKNQGQQAQSLAVADVQFGMK